jgi:hypothetical protein
MKLFSSGEPKDASHVAIGIALLAVLVVVPGAFFAAFVTGMFVPGMQKLPQAQWLPRFLLLAGAWWAFGMIFVLRRYRKVTRHWTAERRGGIGLVVVECVVAVWAFFAPQIHPEYNAEAVNHLRIVLDGFLFLVIVSHVATYAMLRYRPHRREIGAWTMIAVVTVVEIYRLAQF